MQQTISYGILIIVIALVLWRRTRAMVKPIRGNGYKILTPMLFLIPGFTMFESPQLHLKTDYVLGAIVVGLILSVPLILTTNYEVRADGNIYAKKSMGFILSFVGLVIVRLILRESLSGLDQFALGALYFLTAVSYVTLWRITSFIKFRKVLLTRRATPDVLQA